MYRPITQCEPAALSARIAGLLLAGLLLSFATTAHATYTVIDDDLLPTATVEARMTPPAPKPLHYQLSFYRNIAALNLGGRNLLDALAPNMLSASIRVVGRGDAMPYSTGRLATLPRDRAIAIREYLVRHGVPFANITVALDGSPNPQTNGNLYPCDIFVTEAAATSYSPGPVVTPAPAAAVPAAATPAAPAAPTAKSEEVEWNLEGNATLQATLERWSRAAGWRVIWQGEVLEIRNGASANLFAPDFLAAAEFVLPRAQNAAKQAGINLEFVAFTNKVLVITNKGARK